MGRYRKHSISKQVRKNAAAISDLLEDQYRYTTYVDKSSDISEGMVYPPYRDPTDPSTAPPHSRNWSISSVHVTRLLRPGNWRGIFSGGPRNWPHFTYTPDGYVHSQVTAVPSPSIEFKGIHVSTMLKLSGSHWFNRGYPLHYSIHYFTPKRQFDTLNRSRTTTYPLAVNQVGSGVEAGQATLLADASYRNLDKGIDYEEFTTGQIDPTTGIGSDNHFSAHRWYMNRKLYNVHHSHHGTLGCNPLGLSIERWRNINAVQLDNTPQAHEMEVYHEPIPMGVNANQWPMEKIHKAFIPFRRKIEPDVGTHIMETHSDTNKPPPTLYNNTNEPAPVGNPPAPDLAAPYQPNRTPRVDVARWKGWRDVKYVEFDSADQIYMVIFHHHAWENGLKNKQNTPPQPPADPANPDYSRFTAGTLNNRSPLCYCTSLRVKGREPM